ncbi:hypothetical protein EXIGLDRAFT_837477 [Exidia glandulosa HHB12029]|uniref:Novel STAND NTPase 1 domain-containing protein n=1 Tax=Exidia glandulosa HHB12029 TaxID=1314781 RepID=A0A165GRH0_EXIGL|nr:hypothetical protein EXIGLDRAFT_837477 [Exidia glandulosa HHB12029]
MALALGTTVATQAAGVAGQNTTQALLGIAEVIESSARNARVNQAAVIALSRQVSEWTSLVCSELERQAAAASPTWLAAFASFERALIEAHKKLEHLQRRSFLAQLLTQERDAGTIKALGEGIRQSFNALKIHSYIDIGRLADDLDRTVQSWKGLEELERAVAEAELHSSGTGVRVPEQRPIFFGRARERQALVESLSTVCGARVVILGGPGVGKTSLALAALHDAAVVARFGHRRYFVACDAADVSVSALSIIASAFGISNSDRRTLEKELTIALKVDQPILLTLDNFESAWEDLSRRNEAENVLEFLSGFPHLSLVVTIRGAERPGGAHWTRPLRSPLGPLGREEARQVLLAIADVPESDMPTLDKMLQHVENLPLAVVLLGNLAQVESLPSLLSRWETMSTAMLTRDGNATRLSSLDASIRLSIESPRMQQDTTALSLLSVLSLLPDGFKDVDLSLCFPSLAHPRRALAVLLQVSLSYRTADQRVRILVPVREFVMRYYPPSEQLVDDLHEYMFRQADVIADIDRPDLNKNVVESITPEVANITAVVNHALLSGRHVAPTLEAACRLGKLFSNTGVGSLEHIPLALSVARRHTDMDEVTADLLEYQVRAIRVHPRAPSQQDPVSQLQEAISIHLRLHNVDRALTCWIMLLDLHAGSIQFVDDILALADRCTDPYLILRFNAALYVVYKEDPTTHRNAIRDCFARMQRALKDTDPLRTDVGRALTYMGREDLDQGYTVPGITKLRKAIDTFQACNNKAGVSLASMHLGTALLAQGCSHEAIEHLQAVYDGFHAIGNIIAELNSLARLTRAHLDVCDERAAADCLARAERLVRDAGPEWRHAAYGRGQILRAQGELSLWRGDVADARAALLGAVFACRETTANDARGLWGRSLEILGSVEEADGRAHDALTCYLIASVLFRKLGWTPQVTRTLASMAAVVDDETAELLLQATLLPLQRYAFLRVLGNALLCSARVAQRRSTLGAARHRALSALRHFESAQDERGMGRANVFLRELPDAGHGPARNI